MGEVAESEGVSAEGFQAPLMASVGPLEAKISPQRGDFVETLCD